MRASVLIYLPAIILLVTIGSAYINNIPKEDVPPIEVYFSSTDNLTEVFLELIRDHDEVRCALYSLKIPTLVDALKDKGASVITDNDNPLLWGKSDIGTSLMHNKFCIFDREVIWTGSWNPTENGAYKNDNDMVVIRSKLLAKNYLAEFEELDSGIFGKGGPTPYPAIFLNGNKVENLFCPEDRCKDKVLEELRKAQQSVYFMAFSFTDKDIAQALISLAETIEVKGIMEKQRFQHQYNVHRLFSDRGMDVIGDQNKHIFHHKAFIIDAKTVITGSYNPTANGNERNDENIIIMHDSDVAAKYSAYFIERFRNYSDS